MSILSKIIEDYQHDFCDKQLAKTGVHLAVLATARALYVEAENALRFDKHHTEFRERMRTVCPELFTPEPSVEDECKHKFYEDAPLSMPGSVQCSKCGKVDVMPEKPVAIEPIQFTGNKTYSEDIKTLAEKLNEVISRLNRMGEKL
jgi:hypothetical protein